MEVRIKDNNGYVDADWTIEDGIMVVSPKEVKFEPKDGDVCKSTFCIYIFKRVDNAKAVVYHCCLNVDQDELSVKQSIGVGNVDEYQRYATEAEKKKLFDKLAEEGYEWDAEKKEVVKIKWKPKFDTIYYKPQLNVSQFRVASVRWYNLKEDEELYQKGWVFQTNEDCAVLVEKLNQAIKGVKP